MIMLYLGVGHLNSVLKPTVFDSDKTSNMCVLDLLD